MVGCTATAAAGLEVGLTPGRTGAGSLGTGMRDSPARCGREGYLPDTVI